MSADEEMSNRDSLSAAAGAAAPRSAVAGFVSNLIAGLRLLTFRRVDGRSFVPSARQALLFAVLAALLWIGLERIGAAHDVNFTGYGIVQLGWLALIALGLLVLFTPTSRDPTALGRSLTACASMLPALTLLAVALDYLAQDSPFERWVGPTLALCAAIYLARAKLVVGKESKLIALLGSAAVVLISAWVYVETVTVRPQFWYAAAASDEGEDTTDWMAAEKEMYRQPELLNRALASLAPQDPARPDVYFVGFAGDGEQEVFAKEVNIARDALEQRLDLKRRELVLANAPQPGEDVPLASTTALQRALAALGQKMDVANDVLVLYVTSHGSDDGSVAVSQAGMPFNDLYVDDLKEALDASGIEWRIQIVSACYSGTIIEPLRNDHTIIFTAARADRTSFGCSDERELTYFGEALFREALPTSASLLDAFARTQKIIAGREKSEGLKASQPQLYVGERMRGKLAELHFAVRGQASIADASAGGSRGGALAGRQLLEAVLDDLQALID